MEKNTDGSIHTRVLKFLFLYHRTPHTTTGVPPAELLLGRIPLSHLNLLKPDISLCMKAKQRAQQENHDIQAKEWKFEVGESVFVKDFPSGKQWLPGVIFTAEGPRSYLITLSDDRRVRPHVDHVRKRISEAPSPACDGIGRSTSGTYWGHGCTNAHSSTSCSCNCSCSAIRSECSASELLNVRPKLRATSILRREECAKVLYYIPLLL